MWKSWRRRAGAIVVAVLIAAGLVYAFSPRPVPVDLATIDRDILEVTVNDDGVTRIRDVYIVSAPISGRMQRSPREIGDTVTAGRTLVAVIRPTQPSFLDERGRREAEAEVRAAEAAQGLAEAEVRRAEAELSFARSDLDRSRRLAKTETISARALDQATLDVAVKEAALATARASLAVRGQELESARARLIEPGGFDGIVENGTCCVNVHAPVDGQVLKITHESEQVVSAGTPLIEVGDPADLELAVDVLSAEAVKVSKGAIAHIERWGGDKTLTARVTRIEPAGFEEVSALGIEEQRVTIVLDPEGDTALWKRLGHDYRVFARIVIWRSDSALRVPLSALFRVGQRWAVFVDEDGTAVRRFVTIGARNDRHAEVTDGLEPGERVVAHPSDSVDDGVRIVERKLEET